MSYLKDQIIDVVIQYAPLDTICPSCGYGIDPGCISNKEVDADMWDKMAREILDVVVGCVMEYLGVD